MNAIDAIYKRRSVRKFVDKKVDRDMLLELVKLATAAPSAMNKKPWKFVVIDDKETMSELRGVMRFGRFNAPAAIIVCGNMRKAIPLMGKDYWVQDCSAAMENIHIGAVDMGLGSVWLGVYPIKMNVENVSALLGLPKHIVPLGIAYVGYPIDEQEPRTQFDDDDIVFGRMGESRKPKLFAGKSDDSMDAMTNILGRRSIRKYTGRVIDDAVVKELLSAGFSAPTAMNTRPWHFVVIRDKGKLEDIQGNHPYAKMLQDAGCGILVCGDTTKQPRAEYLAQDCSAAIENILLAANANGLGAVWLGIYPNEDRMSFLTETAGLPEHIMPIGLVAVGYGREYKDNPDRYDKDNVHFEEF